MRQILQNLGSGETLLAELPAPGCRPGSLLIRSRASLLSLGTERMLVDFGKAGWIEKARRQPDKVAQVLAKVRTDGLFATLDAVKAKLDQPIPLGYCNVGEIVEGSPEVLQSLGCKPGDRVVSNGPHAECVCVPRNLCARIPDGVPDDAAAFTVVGSIALQGIRLAAPTLGETVVVTGLGLIGLLAVLLLRAQGCRVIGIDVDPWKCGLARSFGAVTVDLSAGMDPVAVAMAHTRGRGVDAVLITASTKSSEPVHQAALMSRKRGRIVLVGVTGLELSRADFYEKELSFQVSCSYGPGRYDEAYEQRGEDYPVGFVRWTEQRNFEAFLDLLASGQIDPLPLVTHRLPFADALRAYAGLGSAPALGIVLEYGPPSSSDIRTRTVDLPSAGTKAGSGTGRAVVGLIGAGNFTGITLLPALRATGARLKTIASNAGVTGSHLGEKFGFEVSTTDTRALIADPEIDVVLITTRHDSHARLAIEALRAGKKVYVEKPLCLTRQELDEIREVAAGRPDAFVMVGFNRRFAPQVRIIMRLLDARPQPKAILFTANAGAIPAGHWTQDPRVGGGRIVGEACHFVDLLSHLVGHPVVAADIVRAEGSGAENGDVALVTLKYADGSVGSIHYLSNGPKSFPKERLEVFCGGGVLQLDNFRTLRAHGWKGASDVRLWRQDKGHAGEMQALVEAVRSGAASPVPLAEAIDVTRVCLDLAERSS
jgi:predicted dehydrogenase/threonine dehydrogenase-like Zn-dependent dehydrogenase